MYISVHGGLLLYVLFRTARQSCLMILLFCADSAAGRRSTCTDQAQRLFQLFFRSFYSLYPVFELSLVCHQLCAVEMKVKTLFY